MLEIKLKELSDPSQPQKIKRYDIKNQLAKQLLELSSDKTGQYL